MIIRRAEIVDIDAINHLLYQVLEVHAVGRPDLFKSSCKKYTDHQLAEIIRDDSRPIFVAEMDGRIVGYTFLVCQQSGDNIMQPIRTVYIDDLCVDCQCRSRSIGTALYRYVCDFARDNGCYNVTLNVWSCNQSAIKFYEKMGMQPYKMCMEQIL